jgi:site-specific DNA recombinase
LLDLNGGADDVSGDGIARLFLTIVSAFSEFERSRIGERIRSTKQAQRARGEFSGGRPPYGWRHSGVPGDKVRPFVPIPEQQQVIKRILRLADRGMSAYRISDDLKEAGISLSHMTCRKILKRQGQPR